MKADLIGRRRGKWDALFPSPPKMNLIEAMNIFAARPVNTVFDYYDFIGLHKQIVYAWVRGKEVLYVGISIAALQRLFGHNVIGADEPWLPGDNILIWAYDTWHETVEVEARLIATFKPRLNGPTVDKKGQPLGKINCQYCKKEFQQRRWYQRYCSEKCKVNRKPNPTPLVGAAS